MARHFDIRKSPVDGLLRLWEQRSALSLGMITQDQIVNEEAVNGPVWVVTGVHRVRREVFNRKAAA